MAMAAANDMQDGSLLHVNSIGSDDSEGVLSPEDVAWADSCLIKDLLVLDNGLDSLKHALPETLPSQTIFSAVMMDDSPQESLIFPPSKETGIAGIIDDMIDDVSPTSEQEENTILHQMLNSRDTDGFESRTNSENVFLPTYKENLRLVEASDSETDLEFPTFVEENLAEDIFKVWELDIPDEEDELVKQLNKALRANSSESSPKASESLGVQDNKLLDDLISGLGDLSLSPTID